MASMVGLYRDFADDHVGRIFVRDGKLMASASVDEELSVELTPAEPNRFVVSGTPIALVFVPATPGHPDEVRVTGAGPRPSISQKLPPIMLSSAELHAFAGEYTSQEVEGTYTVVVRDSHLTIQITGRPDIVLQPVFRDAFAGTIVGVVKFSRDGNGAVTGFTVNTDGARGLRFDLKRRQSPT